MADDRGSQYSPTFVYRREKEGGGTQPKAPLATDLHVTFNKGGVSVTDKAGAEEVDRKDTKGDEADFKFPPSKKIKAGDHVKEPKPKKGDDQPEAPKPPPESSFTPTFHHSDPTFPGIKEWWWTHTRWNGSAWENYEGPHHTGNPTGWENG
jgi:hypothetical protein